MIGRVGGGGGAVSGGSILGDGSLGVPGAGGPTSAGVVVSGRLNGGNMGVQQSALPEPDNNAMATGKVRRILFIRHCSFESLLQ